MDSFLLLVAALLFVGNRDWGRVGDWGRLGELTAGPASTEVGDDIIGILILVSAALATFRMIMVGSYSTSSSTNDDLSGLVNQIGEFLAFGADASSFMPSRLLLLGHRSPASFLDFVPSHRHEQIQFEEESSLSAHQPRHTECLISSI